MNILQVVEQTAFVEKTLNEVYMSLEILKNHVKDYPADELERNAPVYYKVHEEERLRLQYLKAVYEQRLEELQNRYGAIDLPDLD